MTVRLWLPVRHDYEFRGFVRAGRLVALTQYNTYCFFPHLVAKRRALRAMIERYWLREVRPVRRQRGAIATEGREGLGQHPCGVVRV